MTPKEKAKELVDKCYLQIEDATAGLFTEDVNYVAARKKAAKQCALIAVDEIIIALEEHQWQNRLLVLWYKEVKTEIENL